MPAPKQKRPRNLTVAVTGPTGTFGHGLMPLLEADDRVERVIGIARRPFDPADEGWTKLEYRQGDVRDADALEAAFEDADVVVHLAFLITGTDDRAKTRAVNIEGTLNAFRAAAAAGVQRFVYASSVAAYGFHRDNPVGMDEDWPTRPASKLFYAQEKAELEQLLTRESEQHPEMAMYLLRPPIVLGPDAGGGKDLVPEKLAPLARAVAGRLRDSRVRLPVLAPTMELQVIHQDDVGRALMQCVLAAGPPAAYNIAADEVLTGADIARELGLRVLPFPGGVVHGAARALSAIPTPGFLPQVAEWVEAASHPAIMDTRKAARDLHFEPQISAREAVRQTLNAAASDPA